MRIYQKIRERKKEDGEWPLLFFPRLVRGSFLEFGGFSWAARVGLKRASHWRIGEIIHTQSFIRVDIKYQDTAA